MYARMIDEDQPSNVSDILPGAAWGEIQDVEEGKNWFKAYLELLSERLFDFCRSLDN